MQKRKLRSKAESTSKVEEKESHVRDGGDNQRVEQHQQQQQQQQQPLQSEEDQKRREKIATFEGDEDRMMAKIVVIDVNAAKSYDASQNV